MAIVLKADNSSLTTNAKYSYLSTNYSSGVTSIVVTNGDGFAALDYLLLGEFGNETAEIVQISAGGVSTHTLTIGATKFAHAESTKVTILKYNQVKFYHTTTTAFSAGTDLSGFINIQPDSLYTIFSDTTYTTGYGWFCFYNAQTTKITSNSNYIPYAGFAANSVKKLIEDFYSQLSVTEQKLITMSEVLTWFSEAYSIVREELNLSNKDFNAEDHYDLATEANLAEYALPDNTDHIISVYDDDNDKMVNKININEIDEYNESSSNTTKYYIRGNYLGFAPTPSSAVNFIVRYTTKATAVTSYSDLITLPGNNHYILKDFVMYRAAPRLKRQDGPTYLTGFYKGIERTKLISKRDNAQESFGIADSANI